MTVTVPATTIEKVRAKVDADEDPTGTDYSAVGLADNVDFVLAAPDGTSMYNIGMYGPAEWMSSPVSGEEFLHDADTGARPGTLVRSS